MSFKNSVSKNEFLYTKKGVSVYLKREDLLHPHISGNKFRKLKYNILEAQKKEHQTLLTFGGAYSNHISAVAYAGKLHNFKTIGIIRGEELDLDIKNTLKNNTTLKFAVSCGMEFKFITRSNYRNKNEEKFILDLKKEFGEFYIIPEGGTNKLAIKGCQEILTLEDEKFDYICVSVGTGGTITGLINSLKDKQKIIGFPALKGNFLKTDINKLMPNNKNWNLNLNYHFGGFAKINIELITFINKFKVKYGISLDPIYTGKMMFGIDDLINKKAFKEGTKILTIHTGGLQGINAMNKKLIKKGLPQIA